MDSDIYALVAKYGFKNLHVRLEELMREEYAYFCLKFQQPIVSIEALQVSQVKQVQEIPLPKKKEKKIRVKKPVQTSELQAEDIQLSLENVEVKDVIVTVSEKTFRDPKEMKEFQKLAVEAKRKENEAAGFQPSHFLTKENLKQWIEDEGQTYAWVAREKAGCPETQVSATAQMMGIKSRISKKMGRTMTGN
jgi:hypothetical protein